jgi:hypothetical protein
MSLFGTYVQVAKTYVANAGSLLILGAVVFVPLGLLDTVVDHFAPVQLSHLSDLPVTGAVALLGGVVAQVSTSLLGEVFYSGAVALLLVHGADAPPLRQIARRLKYGRLIVVDLLLGLGVAVGFILFLIPGLLVFTWYALAGPVVEIEGRGVRAALSRSRDLVRGRFWTVMAILVPITVASELLTEAAQTAIESGLGESLLAEWLGAAAASIAFSPLYAVTAVLLAVQLARLKDQTAP